jgi:hypothetical protein
LIRDLIVLWFWLSTDLHWQRYRHIQRSHLFHSRFSKLWSKFCAWDHTASPLRLDGVSHWQKGKQLVSFFCYAVAFLCLGYDWCVSAMQETPEEAHKQKRETSGDLGHWK